MGESKKSCPLCGRLPGEVHFAGCSRRGERNRLLVISREANERARRIPVRPMPASGRKRDPDLAAKRRAMDEAFVERVLAAGSDRVYHRGRYYALGPDGSVREIEIDEPEKERADVQS